MNWKYKEILNGCAIFLPSCPFEVGLAALYSHNKERANILVARFKIFLGECRQTPLSIINKPQTPPGGHVTIPPPPKKKTALYQTLV